MPHVLQWTSDTRTLQRLICNDLLYFLNFLCASHPLYFAYFIFFSPHLLHLFFYLSPLLLSTSLLLLLTLLIFSSPLHEIPCTSLEAILELLKWKIQACNVDAVLAEQLFTAILDSPVYCNMSIEKSEEEDEILVKNSAGDYDPVKATAVDCEEAVMRLSDFEVISADGETPTSSASSVYLSLTSESPQRNENLSENGSENLSWSITRRRREHLRTSSLRSTENDLQRDGSMRREKEWKRTLACKLYEERMTYKLCEEREVAEGCQEMDMLWEAYEVDALKLDKNGKNRKKDRKKEEKNRSTEELEEHDDPELCCLQALRFSAGKVNLGRPNLMKITKALTGIGLLQRIGSRRIK